MSEPLFDKELKYCLRCCMPETAEGILFDERGVCNACNSSEEKMHINWEKREKALRTKLEKYKEKFKDRSWDCIVPISGGKDSFWQSYVLTKIYGMRPLAVTFSHNWYTEVGKRNLNLLLETFDLDHLMYTPKRSFVNRVAKRSIEKIGDSCWHCHAGIGAFVIQISIKFNVPLIIWGESTAEEGCRLSYFESIKKDVFDGNYFTLISARRNIEEMTDKNLPVREFEVFRYPSTEEYREAGIEGFHLGDYQFWDEERRTEFIIREFGWEEATVEGSFKRYKSVECIMPGLHDWTKFIKRGYGRATDQATKDVRAGLLTREEGFEIIKNIDPKRPEVLDFFLEQTEMTEEDLIHKVKSLRKGAAKKLP
jgi:N-acetyl sugar amidotransferase